MKTARASIVPGSAKIVLAVVALAVLTGGAFAMWARQGAGIFMALVESGLAWCF